MKWQCKDGRVVEIKDMSEINASKSGKPVNPFGCKNCGLFVSTREDWNTRVQSNGRHEPARS